MGVFVPSGRTTGQSLTRWRFRTYLPSVNWSIQGLIHQKFPSRNGVHFWYLRLAIAEKSPLGGTAVFASGGTIPLTCDDFEFGGMFTWGFAPLGFWFLCSRPESSA
jgi:hypothetical protein